MVYHLAIDGALGLLFDSYREISNALGLLFLARNSLLLLASRRPLVCRILKTGKEILGSLVSLVALFDLPQQRNLINSSTLHGAAVALSRRARFAWELADVVCQRLSLELVLGVVLSLNAAFKAGPVLYKQ